MSALVEKFAAETIEAATARTKEYLPRIAEERLRCQAGIGALPIADMLKEGGDKVKRYVGKVRDVYTLPDGRALLLATGRQSAFDRNLATIPFKGQVLNTISLYWFEETKHIVANHTIASPHPNALLCRACKVFPVEFVVRGYITGSTSTSIWTHYNAGKRVYCGIDLPEGLKKNDALWTPLLTPSTKDDVHDEPISPADIVATGRMTQAEWDTCAAAALALFAFGQARARERGLILVDTKYEFGTDARTGEITLIDEVHTPDSSRYWVAGSYEARHAAGEEPENIDKEFLRLWFRERCDPYKDKELPTPPGELIDELSRRYIMLYELITGRPFEFPKPREGGGDDITADIAEALRAVL